MKNRLLKKACMIAAAMAYGVAAVQPNYVKTTTYDVNYSGDDVITTEYSDGLGRSIQTKLRLGGDRDRVSCTFYDEAGRLKYVTKPFVDYQNKGVFLPGSIIDNGVIDNVLEQQLYDQYTDIRAFDEFDYWDDPLGRIQSKRGPGLGTSPGYGWIFGVGRDPENFSVGAYSFQFEGGFIVSTITLQMLFALTNHLLTNDEFTDPSYFLTITEDENGKFAQVLRDIFGRTVATRTDPDASAANDQVLSEYQYDILGNVRYEIPPKDNTNTLIGNTEYRYNTLGQIIWKHTPDGGVVEYTYFPDGNVQFVTTYEGGSIVRKLTYTYDELGRPSYLKEYGPNINGGFGSNEREIATWAYDDLDIVASRSIFRNIPETHISPIKNTKGRLSAVIYSNHGEKRTYVGEIFSYDDEGRLRFKITSIEGVPGFQLTCYEYDIHGKPTVDYCFYIGDIIKKKYLYDHLGRLCDVYHCVTADGGQTYTDYPIAGYGYNDIGQMSLKGCYQIGSYNIEYDYDIRDRLTRIMKPSNKKGFDETVSLYDQVGNIKNAQFNYFISSPTTATKEFDMTYDYDDIYRLKTATPSATDQITDYGTDYDYDQGGRFTGKQEGTSNLTGYQYYSEPSSSIYTNRLKQTSKNSSGQEYIYDTHGNLVVDYTKKMVAEYDWRDMPVTYRFYSAIPSGITKNSAGTGTNSNLYEYMRSKVDDGTIQLASTVIMLYNAAGERVSKIEVKD
ncbi:MAG: hypothetical protein JW913_05780 [Chitinispirillaceae bacterium]|nr:hypothetical protein [Chitinispirillaceae bacterium]